VNPSWAAAAPAPADPAQVRGLPFIRTYPLDEIGNVPRGLRLDFDAFGRVAVMYDGIYSVLNNSAWVDRIDKTAESKLRMTTIKVVDGKYYYGGRGSWGMVELTPEGTFRAAPLVPADAPAWTSVTAFNKLLGTRQGIYFYELNGLVFWDYARRRNIFFEMPRITTAFTLGEHVFVSCQDRLVRELDPATGASHVIDLPPLDVEYAVSLDEAHALLALYDGRVVSFDGKTITPWPLALEYGITGKITAMERLVDGGVALAIDDKGIFLLTAGGTPQWSLLSPEFRRIRVMAAGEPGVLWVAGENAVHRIFYDSPLTSFGQQSGLKASWPRIDSWNGRIVAYSNRTIYRLEPGSPGRPPTFQVLAGGPAFPINNLAASGPHLLVGTPKEVLAIGADGALTPLIQIENVAGLKFIRPDTCIAIGSREIAALQFTGGRWTECAPRIKGVGDAPIQLELHRYLWIEMGGDQVARLTLRDGVIDLQRLTLPWSGERWTNVGMIDQTIVLTGASSQRAYYDEAQDAFCTAPRLDRLLRRSPYRILRMTQDENGILWATHAQGVVTFTPHGDDYDIDPDTYDLPNDSYPTIAILPGANIWIAAGWSLYHVEPQAPRTIKLPHTVLVSLVADHRNHELLSQSGLPASPLQFSYDDNSLSFRFFSGTYAWRFPPQYEYRLGSAEPWTPVDPSLVLRFPKLRDGSYRLEVRQARPSDAGSSSFALPFVILPPWYRTPLSYLAYSLMLLLTVVGIARWINHQSLRKNANLERLVHERTKELETTMEKLGEETRNAATLAERSRLAGEIHDSVQQGLSGAILHLDTTMTNPAVSRDVHAQMNIVRDMLSYSREEVQQAVWNLESPLLQDSTLGDALRKLAGYLRTGAIEIKVVAQGEPEALDQMIQHNLLRIAQEAITNAVKHAAAGQIEVTLLSQPRTVVLRVTDNGQGFDPAMRSRAGGHLGLRGLRSRAKTIKADLQIISLPGAGTTIQVTVPLNPIKSHDPTSQNQPA